MKAVMFLSLLIMSGFAYGTENLDSDTYTKFKDEFGVNVTNRTAIPSDDDLKLTKSLFSCVKRYGSLLNSEYGYIIRGSKKSNHIVVRRLVKTGSGALLPANGVLVYSEKGGVLEFPANSDERAPGVFKNVPTMAYSGLVQLDDDRITEQRKLLEKAETPSLEPDYSGFLLNALEANYNYHADRVLNLNKAYEDCLATRHAKAACKTEKQSFKQAVINARALEQQRCEPAKKPKPRLVAKKKKDKAPAKDLLADEVLDEYRTKYKALLASESYGCRRFCKKPAGCCNNSEIHMGIKSRKKFQKIEREPILDEREESVPSAQSAR